MAGREDERPGTAIANVAGHGPTARDSVPEVQHEVELFLAELDGLCEPGEEVTRGFRNGGPNVPYLHFLRRRVHAIRKDNFLLRREAEGLRQENAGLRDEAEKLSRLAEEQRAHAEAERAQLLEAVRETTRINRALEQEIRAIKTSRSWKLANALGGVLSRPVRRLRRWVRGSGLRS